MSSKTLGISMIVKNEAGIITRCLESIVDYLDYWVVHDTGSTDGTPEVIQQYFDKRGIRGELHHTPWKNFGYNRTEALKSIRGKVDYVLLLDADFVVHIKNPAFKEQLKSPGYLVRYEGGLDYRQILLIDISHNWAYYGVTHEYIDTRPQLPVEITELLTIEHTGEGSNRAEKFERDVNLLLQGIVDEPDNARYYFYLAQSYKDWDHFEEAIKYYTKRISFPAWDEEVFYSYYQIAMCKKRRGDDFYDYVGDYLKAWQARQHRIEPLYQILEVTANDPKMAEIGFQIGMLNSHLTYPTYDLLFIEKPLYDWMYLDMLSTAAHTAGRYVEALELMERLVHEKKYPARQAERFETNLAWLRQQVEISQRSELKLKPFRFQRIKPEIKENRVAIIIANYNMRERANNLVIGIRAQSQWPVDIILVDNGSDLTPPSPFSAVVLGQNVQTTHAWLAGLRFADSLEITEGFKYLAYAFVITSAELLSPIPIAASVAMASASAQTPTFHLPDLIGAQVQILLNDIEVVGVHPALSRDSTTHWKHLYQRYPPQIRRTNMIDNIFSMYRADWFNSIGRFDPKQTFAWGIDLETSYLARKAGKKLMVNDNVVIRKITDIGYMMKKMNMTAEDRFSKASNQMKQILAEKYGPNFGAILNSYSIEESIPARLPVAPDSLLHTFYATLLNFEKMEGGHRLLMEFIYRHHHRLVGTNPINMLEIGSTREMYPHLNSTRKLLLLAQVYGYRFISVDVDPEVIQKNREVLVSAEGEPAANLTLVCQRAEDFLKQTNPTTNSSQPTTHSIRQLDFPQVYHFVYLDGFDAIGNDRQVSEARNARYQELLNQDLNNDNCSKSHFECVKLLVPKIAIGGIICIGEPEYKARTAKPYLLQNGFQLLREDDHGVLLQKNRNLNDNSNLT